MREPDSQLNQQEKKKLVCCLVLTVDLEWMLVFILTTCFQHKANPCHMEPKLHRVRVNRVTVHRVSAKKERKA